MIIKEILSNPKKDRRLLSNIPDPSRNGYDRRGFFSNGKQAEGVNQAYQKRYAGQRYYAEFPVSLKQITKKQSHSSICVDISSTGILLKLENDHFFDGNELEGKMKLKFEIPDGVMPEGFESKVSIEAKVVRQYTEIIDEKECYFVALEFEQSLSNYLKKRRWGLSIFAASLFLLFIMLLVLLMRAESVIYFKFNKILYFYSIMAAIFLLSRYIFGLMYRNIPVNKSFEPGVSIIIPVFNEEKWIHRTIHSCIDQSYPIDKLEVIVVDDCSSDQSVAKAREAIAQINQEGKLFRTSERLTLYVLEKNSGKREALVEGVKRAKHDLVVFVDSDSFLEPNAICNIVQPFQDPQMGGVAGRTEVENKFTNTLTKLQTVRYYIAFRIMKAAEATFDAVTCLSGPLSCYRKSLVIEHSDAWLNQRFLGHPATFGDDRSMTNYILKSHRTGYQDQAVCSTIVPSSFRIFLKQQMRWKRSWLRESLRAFSFMYKKEPFMFLFFFVGLIVPIAAPIVVTYNLLYVPFIHGIFPTTFLVGLLLMALLLSFAHLMFKKSKLWLFGLVFVLYYEFVLLWQMPVAWVTFWKSTWGTRDTPQDVLEQQKKQRKKDRKQTEKMKEGA
ncbi:glycosyltransferase [Alkalihalobacillus trypoxylicola]|uniref:Hyaluronan synthase n=1 Tax=Alkalihalobacillus trypoxylicola TaxID=519424 RepID=A0A161PCF0_9BACI|nr:glycosyltransferase [Alkalihalobacillus trypoxylicola]KYG29569.1 hyaluronan synthase [Alkalihalobacillus trypoxylicola]